MKSLITNQLTKAVVILFSFLLAGVSSQAQDITGQWNGMLSVQGVNLRLVFHITKTGDSYASTMDSPDQGAAGIPVTATTFDGSKLSLEIPAIGLSYEGEYKTDSIVGTFKQSGISLPMTLTRKPAETKSVVRPQEPKLLYPHRSEDITSYLAITKYEHTRHCEERNGL